MRWEKIALQIASEHNPGLKWYEMLLEYEGNKTVVGKKIWVSFDEHELDEICSNFWTTSRDLRVKFIESEAFYIVSNGPQVAHID